jgi:hypothetical protein
MYADTLELEALEDSKYLIKYAAENNKTDLKKETVLTLETARDANDNGTWSSEIAAEFWAAFSAVCTCVNPVTITSIYSNVPTITVAKWRVKLFRAKPIVSLSERTARRYMALLLTLLAASIVLGYAVNSTKSTTADVSQVLQAQVSNVDALQAEIRSFKKAYGTNGQYSEMATFPVDGDSDMLASVDKMEKLGSGIDQAVNRTEAEVSALMRLLSPFQTKSYSTKPQDFLDTSIVQLRTTIDGFYARQSYVARTTPRIDGIAQFINFALLPVLLGTMGACAYVVRMLSEQIRTTTFTSTSGIRHAVRVALGALTGVVLGFGGYFTPGMASGSILSAAALSFIAGYAVEPVFALLDKIAETFRAP